MQAELVDIGANLTHDSFDGDRDQVVQRAVHAGVAWFILTGSSETSSRDALALARQDAERMRSTAGVHPHHATQYNAEVEATLASLLADPLVVAVGECGLDYFRNFSPVAVQKAAFRAQLELAGRIGKPVFLHQRDAHDDFFGILAEHIDGLAGGVAHCFTGDARMLDAYLELGLYIGITGWICDERRGRQLQEIVSRVPLDRLLIETDAPYLLPRSLRPKPASRRNEPAYLVEVLRVIAANYGASIETIAAASTTNARRLFGFPPAR